jgi:hypothetical protein
MEAWVNGITPPCGVPAVSGKGTLRKAKNTSAKRRPAGTIPLLLANKLQRQLGSARNTAAEFASGQVLALSTTRLTSPL